MKRVPLFKTFKDMNQGFERMLKIAETIENDDAKIEMMICYGCLIETFNEHNGRLYDKWANGQDDDDVQEGES
jgi:hypothetical protein